MKSDDASIRRLKQRVRNMLWKHDLGRFAGDVVSDINAAIDAWRKAEAKRGGR